MRSFEKRLDALEQQFTQDRVRVLFITGADRYPGGADEMVARWKAGENIEGAWTNDGDPSRERGHLFIVRFVKPEEMK